MRELVLVARNELGEIMRSRVLYLFFGLFAALVTWAIVSTHVVFTGGRELSGEASRWLALPILLETTSVVVIVLALVYGADALPRELRTRTLVHVLSRPVSRTTFVLGKWLGILAVLVLLELVGVTVMAVYVTAFGLGLASVPWAGMLYATVIGTLVLSVTMALGLHLHALIAASLVVAVAFFGTLLVPLQDADVPWLRAVGTAVEYLLPAGLTKELSILGGSSVDPSYGVYFLVLLENLVYGGVVLALALVWFVRGELKLGDH